MKKRVLVTGASGFLASRVADCLRTNPDYSVLTPGHKEMDITDPDMCRAWFEKNRPDAVIHLAAVSDIAACEKDPDLSWKVNAQGPANLALCAKEFQTEGRFLFASSDQVYSGYRGSDRLHRESDAPSPGNLYAREKLEAEERACAILPSALTLRLDWMFDLKPGKQNYLKGMILSVKEQRPCRYAVNELRAMTYAWEVAENMQKLLFSDVPGGAYNFGGPPSGSSYETALAVYDLLAQVMDAPVHGLAVPFEREDPRSLAMDQEKLHSAGIFFRDTAASAAYCLEREKDRIPSVLKDH